MKKTLMLFLAVALIGLLANCAPQLRWWNNTDEDYSSGDSIKVTVDGSTWDVTWAPGEKSEYKPVMAGSEHTLMVQMDSSVMDTNFTYDFLLMSKYAVYMNDEGDSIADAIHEE